MRVAARKFAAALWIGAVLVAIDHSLVILRTNAGITYTTLLVAGALAFVTLRFGTLVVLGAIIWLLGDIRDRLSPEE